MRTLLGLCVALLGVACSCNADPVCSVPDTKKGPVTTLAINMARSVGPCVPPDPSVLLALNMGQLNDPTTQALLVKLLKQDAAEKVSNNEPFSSGKVALYVLALQSSCANPSSISVSGGSINLVNILEQKTQEELQSCQNTNSPLTTWYQMSLDVLTLCVLSRPAAFTAANALIAGIGPTAGGSVDTAAMAVMALVCVRSMDDVPSETFSSAEGSASTLVKYLLKSQNDGMIGNAYSTGLAAQALTAAKGLYDPLFWDCAKTLDTVIDLIPKNTFSLPIAAAQVLPFLWGKTYVSLKGQQCPQDNAPMISVDYTVVNDLIGEHFKYTTRVQVREGSTVLQVMELAAQLYPKDFSFRTQESSWGVFVTEINNLGGSTNDKTSWMFYDGNNMLDQGVGQYIVTNNAHIMAVFSKY
ncbi:cobalamin binding intrinsic factor-like [Gastrophryne carolinensis]